MTDVPSPVAVRTTARLVLLLAAVAALTSELVSTSGPMLDRAFTSGVVLAGATALGTYAAAGVLLGLLCLRRGVSGPPLLVGTVALVVLRLGVQGTDGDLRLVLGLLSVALSLAVLVLTAALLARSSGRAVVAGVAGGLSVAAGLDLAWSTWAPVWRSGAWAWVPVTMLGIVTVLLAAGLRHLPPAPAVRGLWLVGPYVGLAVMTISNPAFVSSQTGLPLWTAGPLTLVPTVIVAILLVLPVVRTPRTPTWTDGLLVLVLGGAAAGVFFGATWPGALTPWQTLLVVSCLVLLATGAPLTLARALTRPAHEQRPLRLAGAAACAGLGVIVPLLVYQLDYDVPLGVPNALVPVLVAVLLALMAARARHLARTAADDDLVVSTSGAPLRSQLTLATVCSALLVVGTVAVLPPTTQRSTTHASATTEVRLLDWNLHYGVSAEPAVDLDEIVEVVRASGAQVVTLQEVSRGWLMGGGADMATYLGQQLGMRSVFVPAADRQFGNMVLWDDALGEGTDVVTTALPYGAGPQRRSATSVTLDVAGTPLRVTSVHLQHRMGNIDTRLDQIATLLDAQPASGAQVVAGDLNAEPGWPEVALLASAGLVSAVDEAGDPDLRTFPSDMPTSRIDWVFGSGVTFSEVEVLDVRASDHRPVLTTVAPDRTR